MTYLLIIFLILCSALFSGLTLGLMGLNTHVLKRKIKLKDKRAVKIYKVRKRGNLLLTTLLLGNVAVNAILAIFLGSIATGILAGILATVLIFLFGEIIPQAVISRYAMEFGARTAWIVRILIIILYPICAPIAWILDKLLGEEMPTIFSRQEMLQVFEEHEAAKDSDIDEDEERILKGALSFSDKTVGDVMTPITVATILEAGEKLTPQLLKKLRESGNSRFPVYQGEVNDMIGILYLRELVGRNTNGKQISDFYRKNLHFVKSSDLLDNVFNTFLRTHDHLFVVKDEFDLVNGLISIEDVIEEIVGKEIVDEFDRYEDLRKLARKKTKKVKR